MRSGKQLRRSNLQGRRAQTMCFFFLSSRPHLLLCVLKQSLPVHQSRYSVIPLRFSARCHSPSTFKPSAPSLLLLLSFVAPDGNHMNILNVTGNCSQQYLRHYVFSLPLFQIDLRFFHNLHASPLSRYSLLQLLAGRFGNQSAIRPVVSKRDPGPNGCS